MSLSNLMCKFVQRATPVKALIILLSALSLAAQDDKEKYLTTRKGEIQEMFKKFDDAALFNRALASLEAQQNLATDTVALTPAGRVVAAAKGVQALINVHEGNGTVQEAADSVEYVDNAFKAAFPDKLPQVHQIIEPLVRITSGYLTGHNGDVLLGSVDLSVKIAIELAAKKASVDLLRMVYDAAEDLGMTIYGGFDYAVFDQERDTFREERLTLLKELESIDLQLTKSPSVSCTVPAPTGTTAAGNQYFISNEIGSDSGNGKSKSTPWQHLPGMPSCRGNCASYTPVAGDQFILRGGDTWKAADLGVDWQWSGNSNARIYIGVDLTWHAGDSWARPIFDCGGSSCARMTQQILIRGSYVTIDNVELTGLSQTGGPVQSIETTYDHTEVMNCYIHGWSRGLGSALGPWDNSSNFGIVATDPSHTTGASFHDNVIDGSDTKRDMFNGIYNGDSVYNNVIRYVVKGLVGTFSEVHDNLIEYNVASYAYDHCDLMSILGPSSGSALLVYNNVLQHSVCLRGTVLSLDENQTCSGCVSYAYNNVIYDNINETGIAFAGPKGGTWNFFNNTVECGTDSSPGTGDGGCGSASGDTALTLSATNNHFIKGDTSAPLACSSSSTCVFTNQLTESLTEAKSKGFTSVETYPFSPEGSSGPTIGAGSNLQSLCSAVSRVNEAAGAACQNDTTDACGYNKSNHNVSCPARAPNARPTSGAWEVGTYSGAAGVCPPAGLTATVN